MTEAAAAGSIGLINSVGNLGGFVGPSLLGELKDLTQSFWPGLFYLCFSMIVSATIIFTLGLGHRTAKPQSRQEFRQKACPMKNPTLSSNLCK